MRVRLHLAHPQWTKIRIHQTVSGSWRSLVACTTYQRIGGSSHLSCEENESSVATSSSVNRSRENELIFMTRSAYSVEESFDCHLTFVVQPWVMMSNYSFHVSHQSWILSRCSFDQSIDQFLITSTSISQGSFVEHSIQPLLFIAWEWPLILLIFFHHLHFCTILSILFIFVSFPRSLRDFLRLRLRLHPFALFDALIQQIDLISLLRGS